MVVGIALGCLAPSIARAATAEDYYKAGLTLTQQNQHEQAIKYYQAAVQLDPNHWQAQQAMGTSYYQMGKKPEALTAFDASLKIHPDNPQLKAFADSLRSESPATSPAASGFSTAPVFAAKKKLSSH
jgi:tetratricopeptide (TPR) repeat protein